MASAAKDNLLLLFERPTEPAFIPKGDKKVIFDVPLDYLANRYQASGPEIVSKFGEEDTVHVKVDKIVLPDLSFAMALGRREPFSLFLPWHRQLASRLISIFVGMRNIGDFTSVSLYARDNLNPYLFIYAYSVAILHRPDTKDVPLPPLSEVFPDKFVGGGIFGRIQEEVSVASVDLRVPLEIPRDYTASNLEEEHRVAYFREDLGINLHHWHWHLVYPFDAPRNIVDKDRRGELFYYMHQQILSRYNSERFSNQLGRVKRYVNIREPIPEGYFPKLDSQVSTRVWAPRHRNASLSDINRETDQIKFDLADIERWRERLYQAIHTGAVVNERNQSVPLTETGGIDVLGNIMESSLLSINRNFYGDMHNMGHVAIALCHDPDNRFLETFGVMGDSATAMRDPVFYRWHAMVDDIFQEHKATLARYTVQQLDFTGVKVSSVEVNVIGPGASPKNVLRTFWQQSDVDLSRGLDFNPRGAVYARFSHLQHQPFAYKISVDNGGAARQGTIRIFVAPKFDERGLPMLFRDQKTLFIEMDKYTVQLKPGKNTFERRSKDSSVTIPFERTFRDLDTARPTAGTQAEAQFNFCGCGWPEHMLLPKGTSEGMQFQLFVMVSDFAGDKVDQTTEGACADAASFCGIRDKLYPDKRPMGYPFDRQPRDGADTLNQFVTGNMRVQDIVIKFEDRTEPPRRQGGAGTLPGKPGKPGTVPGKPGTKPPRTATSEEAGGWPDFQQGGTKPKPPAGRPANRRP